MEFDKLKEIIAEVLSVDPNEITLETTFVDDLGADSLDIFSILEEVDDAFNIETEIEDADKIVTVGDALEQIKKAIG
ncbi:acyl carrier protein [Eubacterium oxidoreducens]|uniref:Acyl carrier protein n=1 Tax=Eubacterium oxidoreducens TaxID=1732 RepID=A0A1G6BH88_EUBOX|nr:acyl carrier protein [Eubacterium oxidoreducens]SDB19967.1 acyl carrier protein [Eubacterium oxidoreducens]